MPHAEPYTLSARTCQQTGHVSGKGMQCGLLLKNTTALKVRVNRQKPKPKESVGFFWVSLLTRLQFFAKHNIYIYLTLLKLTKVLILVVSAAVDINLT